MEFNTAPEKIEVEFTLTWWDGPVSIHSAFRKKFIITVSNNISIQNIHIIKHIKSKRDLYEFSYFDRDILRTRDTLQI